MNQLINELSQLYFVKVLDNGTFILIANSQLELQQIAVKYNLKIIKMHTNIQDALK